MHQIYKIINEKTSVNYETKNLLQSKSKLEKMGAQAIAVYISNYKKESSFLNIIFLFITNDFPIG